MANFDLLSMCPAVPNFVPRCFGVTPVGVVNLGLVNWVREVVGLVFGTTAVHICAMESWMSAMALVSIALVATRFLMVVFF